MTPLHTLEQTLSQLPPILRTFTDEHAATPPAPDRWTKKQVIGHLIDSASNNHQRFVRAALAGAIDFPGYDQNQWVNLQQYQQISWDQLITWWTSLNEHLLHIFRQLTPAQWSALCSGGDRGTCTLEQLLERYVAHMDQHLAKMLGNSLAWPAGKTDTWNGFTRHTFTVDGCVAWVVEPTCALPGRPWSWCMEFPDSFTDRCAALQLLHSGFHHAHIIVGNTFGCPAALKHFDAFYR